MAFQQGLSGLNGAAKSLDTIGNNIANASTVGYKSSRNEFADIYATSLFGLSNTNIGIGGKMATVAQQFNQGNISTTNNPLDLAISGEGFFQLNQNGLTTYTRNGQFKMDSDGFIVDNVGRNLTGNRADSTGTIIGGPAEPMKVSLGVVPPNKTSLAQLTANLNYTAEIPPGAFNYATGQKTDTDPVTDINPSLPSTYNYSTTVNVFDKSGTAMGLSLYFQKAGTGAWNVEGYIAGERVLGNAAEDAPLTDADPPVTLSFDTGGRLLAINNDATALNAAINAAVGTAEAPTGTSLTQIYQAIDTAVDVSIAGTRVTPAQIAAAEAAKRAAIGAGATEALITAVVNAATDAKGPLSIDVPIKDGGTWNFNLDLTKLTQYGSTSGVSYISQDGYSAGQFSNLSVDDTGLVQGMYTNGRTLNLGQIHLTSFLNPNGLQPLGDNQWAETAAAGKQNSDAPGNGLLGYLQSGSIEESNVDLTGELVNLIVAQRMYQANAQTISAQSAVLQTLVNLR